MGVDGYMVGWLVGRLGGWVGAWEMNGLSLVSRGHLEDVGDGFTHSKDTHFE